MGSVSMCIYGNRIIKSINTKPLFTNFTLGLKYGHTKTLHMNLFINAVSASGMLILFNEQHTITSQKTIQIKWNESSKLTAIVDDFLTENKQDYSNIDNIVVVHGPGSFTGVRAICLMVNTIAFSTHTRLTPISYFDLFSTYPTAKQSSKRDMFFKASWDPTPSVLDSSDSSLHEGAKNIVPPRGGGEKQIQKLGGVDSDKGSIQIMSNEDVLQYLADNNIQTVYWEAPMWWEGQIVDNIDYCDILKCVKLDSLSQVDPLYIKKPNIC